MAHFNFDYLSSRPDRGKQEMPLWCDYIELLCLIMYKGEVAKGEVIDVVFKEGAGVIVQDGDEEDYDDDLDDDDVDASDPLSRQLASLGSSKGQKDDRQEAIAIDWFNYLASRQTGLGEMYPFIADSDKSSLKIKSNLKPIHHLYLYLLLASNLHLFSPELRTKITTDFEYICFEVQKLMFPLMLTGVKTHTHIFGKNPTNNSVFTGNLKNKLIKLGELIQARKLDTDFLDARNSGDNGIDLVSVMKFDNDNAYGPPLIISQCACSYKEWKKKQHDNSPERYRQFNLFDVDYLRLMFIPMYYRNQSGQWFEIRDVFLSVMDRLRIMKVLLYQNKKLYNQANNWSPLVLLPTKDEREIFAGFLAE